MGLTSNIPTRQRVRAGCIYIAVLGLGSLTVYLPVRSAVFTRLESRHSYLPADG